MVFDVIVVGAGIVGAAVARDLARDGHRVVVLDRSAAASATSAHCEGNILVSDKGPGPELDLALDARRRWPDLAGELRDELGPDVPSVEFEAKGGLVVSSTSSGALALSAFAAAQRTAGVDAQEVDAAAAHELEPFLTDALTSAVWYPGDAQVHPTIAVEALLASARRSGAHQLTGAEVTGPIHDADGALCGVLTTAGPVHAPVVVNAAGPWSGGLGARLGAAIPVRPRRGVVLVTARMPQRVFHKVYDADYVGAVGSGSEDLHTSSVVESTAAGTVLIGSSREQVGFGDELSAQLLGELARKALVLFPFLADCAVVRTYAGFRPHVPDHLPVIGADPRVPGLWHATGHEGAGVGLSIATSALLAALLGGREPTVDPAPFAPGRPALMTDLEAA